MKTEDIKKEMMDAIMYADMDEDIFWSTSTINPKEAHEVAKAWNIIYTVRLRSEILQRKYAKEFVNSENKEINSHQTKQIVQTRSGDKPDVSENRLSGSQQGVKTGDNTLLENSEEPK